MRTRALRYIGVAVFTTVTAMVAFGGTASAQTEAADDLPILAENLPAAVEALVTGLEEAATVATDTQSAVATSEAIGEAIIAGGFNADGGFVGELVAGTEQFGALALGAFLGQAALQGALAPYLGAIDGDVDPGELFSEDDVQIILDNLAPTIDDTRTNLTSALAEGAQGNFVAPGLLDPASGSPALVGDLLSLAGGLGGNPVLFTLLQDSSFGDLGTAVGIVGLVGGAAVGSFAGEYLVDLEDSFGSALADAEELEPVVAILQTL